MLIEEALIEILTLDPAVAAIVGKHVFPGVQTQTLETPAIVFYIPPGTNRQRGERLESRGFNGLTTSTYRMFCIAKKPVNGVSAYKQAKLLEMAVFLALEGYAGVVSDDASPESTVEIQRIHATGFYAEFYDDETETRQVVVDYEVSHSETMPEAV